MKHENQKEVLRLENVNKVYNTGGGDFNALRDLSLSIKKGDFISILGPSGSGKSTLLHIMGLLDSPTTGKVFVDSIETSRMSQLERARIRGSKIGFVFQSFNLIPGLTALENVKLPLMISGVSEPSRTQRAIEVLSSLGMADRVSHLPNQLSGGQKQRVAIARALVNNPEIIFADEPTGNLDSASGKDVLNIFDNLHESGKTVLIITHDENITKVTHKTIRIMDGSIV